METEFYKSIPPEIREKLQEYTDLANTRAGFELKKISTLDKLSQMFLFRNTIEGFDFWNNHYLHNTFPIWSAELNRFIDPPTNIDINENPNKFYPL